MINSNLRSYVARRFTAVGTVVLLVAGLLAAGTVTAQAVDTGSISGTVTNSGGAGIANVSVTVYKGYDNGGVPAFANESVAYTAGDGTYTVGGLPAGTYRIGFIPLGFTYADEFFNNAATLVSATDITLAANATVTGKNAVLSAGAHITGEVTNLDGDAI